MWLGLSNLTTRGETSYVFPPAGLTFPLCAGVRWFCFNAFALSGRTLTTSTLTQGAASLALGYVLLPFQGAW